MKLKPHSIRFKFFSAISLVALMFIGILLLLNLFFYQDYFMMTRKSSLCDAFDSVCGSYDGDMDDIVTVLDSYESRSAIRLAVAMDDGTVLTSSFLHDRGDHAAPDFEFGMNVQQFRSIAVLASVMQNEDWSSLAERQPSLLQSEQLCVHLISDMISFPPCVRQAFPEVSGFSILPPQQSFSSASAASVKLTEEAEADGAAAVVPEEASGASGTSSKKM